MTSFMFRRVVEQAIEAIRHAREVASGFERTHFLSNEAFVVETCGACGESTFAYKLRGYPVVGTPCSCYPDEDPNILDQDAYYYSACGGGDCGIIAPNGLCAEHEKECNDYQDNQMMANFHYEEE